MILFLGIIGASKTYSGHFEFLKSEDERHKCLAQQQQQRRQLRHKLHNVLLIPFTVNFEGPLKFDRIDFYRKTFLVHSSRDCCSGLRRR